MKAERWQRISMLFQAALEQRPDRYAAFLDEACAGDESLRQEVESLVDAHKESEDFIETPAIERAAPMLANDRQDSILVGRMIAHYKILASLGAGGMGEVFLAQDTKLGRQVGLKLLPDYFTWDQDRLRRFQQEACSASTLSHPNVCVIHEVGETDAGRHFIAMEYVDGVTLRERMNGSPSNDERSQKGTLMKLDDALDVATQIASALAAAHSSGVVHRDIKPENIMVRSDGLVKILDFGLAKLISPETATIDTEARTKAFGKTHPGMIMGTPHYLSPEQAKGLEVDARTDIWSLGVVLYEMVAGRPPFEGETQSHVIVSILEKEPALLTSYKGELPAQLERIVNKALRKNREERYQTANDLAFDLKSARKELEFAILRPIQQLRHLILRRALTSPRAIAMVATATLVIVAVIYAMFLRGAPATRPSEIKLPAHSVNSEAYDHYLRARFHAGLENEPENDAAIEQLEQAVKIDPNFALAYADLGMAYTIKARYIRPQEKEWAEKGYAAAEKALQLDQNLAEAHVARGYLLWTAFYHFSHEAAAREFRRAVELNPDLADAHHYLANVYNHIGLLDKAQTEIQRAIADPTNTGAHFRVGVNLLYQGKYEQALAAFADSEKFNPELWGYQNAYALFQLGRKDEAAVRVKQSLAKNPQDKGGALTSMEALLAASAGDVDKAEAKIKKAIEIGQSYDHFHHTAYAIASASALLNKREDAIKWLQFTADNGFPCYPLFARDPSLNNLRQDVRFITFMTKLKQQWEHDKATL